MYLTPLGILGGHGNKTTVHEISRHTRALAGTDPASARQFKPSSFGGADPVKPWPIHLSDSAQLVLNGERIPALWLWLVVSCIDGSDAMMLSRFLRHDPSAPMSKPQGLPSPGAKGAEEI